MATMNIAQLENRLARLEASHASSLRFGTVTEVNEKEGTARVQLPDGQGVVTYSLQILQARTLRDKKQCFPDVGEPVACLFSGQGMEQGVVLGAVYQPKVFSPNQEKGIDYTRYEDGTEIIYDRTKHELQAKVKGAVKIEAEGNILAIAMGAINFEAAQGLTLKAPHIELKGNLRQTNQDGGPAMSDLSGTFRVYQGDVQAGTVSLLSHAHENVNAGLDTSGPPVGDSGASENNGG